MGVMRYPGAKSRLLKDILPRLDRQRERYVEPFFGGGSVGLAAIRPGDHVWINDLDRSMWAVWESVSRHHEELTDAILSFEPTAEAFYEFKRLDGSMEGGVVGEALRKIALHRMSFSGYGAMAGSPIGGKEQTGKYKVGCRWNARALVADVAKAFQVLDSTESLKVTCLTALEVLGCCGEGDLVYLDPPYYVQGNALYTHGMDHQDHASLAEALKRTKADWFLSYDNCQEIRDLYAECPSAIVGVKYTNAKQVGGKRASGSELLIAKPIPPF